MDLNDEVRMPIQYGEEVWYAQKNWFISAELTHHWSSVIHVYKENDDGSYKPLWVGPKTEFLSDAEDSPRNLLNMINIRRIREN